MRALCTATGLACCLASPQQPTAAAPVHRLLAGALTSVQPPVSPSVEPDARYVCECTHLRGAAASVRFSIQAWYTPPRSLQRRPWD
ncbi:hypothetical protein B0H10DRAFT_2214395 [Mycena sp. CBHHK59/15]|nr:hypothetical protein B0H10DRAFT_2214395 [Mycena sp. CBHHK59/15]